MFFGWSAEIAHEFGLFHATFLGGCGFGFACYQSLWLNLPHKKTDSYEFTLPDFPEASTLHITQMGENLRMAKGSEIFSVFLQQILPQWSNSDGILLNSVEDLDEVGLSYFRRKTGKSVWAIGPIISFRRCAPDQVCTKWLDTKPLNSVLYISFGSQYIISASQTMELALALEASGRNFIWVFRPPVGCDKETEFKPEEWLPLGFQERIERSKRGLIVHGWAPQVEILSHGGVGAFLSHCGWNSVAEALWHGKVLLGWPLGAEQFHNVKLLEENLGVCVEVARGNGCNVGHADLAAKIESVMDEAEKASNLRKKASEVREMMRNAVKFDEEDGFKGSSVKAMEDFLDAAEFGRPLQLKVERN